MPNHETRADLAMAIPADDGSGIRLVHVIVEGESRLLVQTVTPLGHTTEALTLTKTQAKQAGLAFDYMQKEMR